MFYVKWGFEMKRALIAITLVVVVFALAAAGYVWWLLDGIGDAI